MPSLNGQISFTVKFDLTGVPTLKLQASTTIATLDKPNLTGYFYIKQPDCIERTGTYTPADVVWNGTDYDIFSIPLRVGSDGLYQRGEYQITFFADCTTYTPGQFTRTFNIQYLPVSQTLVSNFDCFTPSLTYADTTNYGVGNYIITTQTQAWAASCTAGTAISTTSTLDLIISGKYYDCNYAISYVKTIGYQHSIDTWLTVSSLFTNTISKAAFIPATMALLLTYLIAAKNARDAAANCAGDYDRLDELFEDANSLYQLMRARVCAQNTTGLVGTFDEFYRLTHNYQPQVYINTNAIIPPYDFTTGCGNTGGTGVSAVVTECVVGGTPVTTGTASPVTGITNGNSTVTCAAFSNMRVRVTRGALIIPGIDPGDGSNYFTKSIAASSVLLSAALATGEYLKIETIP